MFRRGDRRLSFALWAGLAAWLFVSGQNGARAQDAPLPTGKEILAKHVAAIGGETAWKAIQSLRGTGTFELTAQGMSGSLEMMAARPAKLLIRVTLQGIGKVETGYDGKIAWSMDPVSGPALLKDRALLEMADDALFDGPLHGPDHIQTFTPVSRETFAKRPAYKVKVVFKSGNEQFEYFDVETGRLVGFEGTRETPMGNVPTTEVISEYQLFQNVRLPTSVLQRAIGMDSLIRMASFEFDTVPATTFNLPPAIKALIK